MQIKLTMAEIKVKVLEFFGPSKFSVRPVEGSFHNLQRKMDLHYFDLQCDTSQSEERMPLNQGDSVRSVLFILPT